MLGVVFGLAQGGRREEVLRGCGWDAYSHGAPHGGLRGPPLHLSHPREGTGAVLFLGQVTSPSAEKTELLLAKICRNWIRWSEVPGTGSPRHDLLTATVEFRNDHPFPVEGTYCFPALARGGGAGVHPVGLMDIRLRGRYYPRIERGKSTSTTCASTGIRPCWSTWAGIRSRPGCSPSRSAAPGGSSWSTPSSSCPRAGCTATGIPWTPSASRSCPWRK